MLSDRRQTRIPGEAQRRMWRWIPLLFLVGVIAGCNDDEAVDRTPPAIPSGVYSITADQQIILRWIPNREPDLAGYSVWWNDDGGPEYLEIARLGALDNYIDSLDVVEFVDAGDNGGGLVNGSYNYYAVSAVDFDGNESDLSLEFIEDVPRPEGYVLLEDRNLAPNQSGFRFATNTIVPFDSADADVWFETAGPVGYLYANPANVRIQDYGNVGFDVLSFAPYGGWSVAGRVEAIEGHTYAVEIQEDVNDPRYVNYGKLTVYSLTAQSDGRPLADMDWAYQGVSNEVQLKGAQSTKRSGTGRVRRVES